MTDKLMVIQTAIEHHFKHIDEPDMISAEIMVEPQKLAESILWALEQSNKHSEKSMIHMNETEWEEFKKQNQTQNRLQPNCGGVHHAEKYTGGASTKTSEKP